jgi:hypothetical protein
MEVNANLKDDPTIPDSELLYRGIHQSQVKQPGNEVSSAAFKNPGISVDLSSLSTPQQTHSRRPSDVGVIQLVTGTVRTITPGVARDPVEGNPAHALIIHDFSLGTKERVRVARRLAKASTWAIAPKE